MQFFSKACWYSNWKKITAILSKFTVLCLSFQLVAHSLELRLILFYNRVVYYHSRIFLILRQHSVGFCSSRIYHILWYNPVSLQKDNTSSMLTFLNKSLQLKNRFLVRVKAVPCMRTSLRVQGVWYVKHCSCCSWLSIRKWVSLVWPMRNRDIVTCSLLNILKPSIHSPKVGLILHRNWFRSKYFRYTIVFLNHCSSLVFTSLLRWHWQTAVLNFIILRNFSQSLWIWK